MAEKKKIKKKVSKKEQARELHNSSKQSKDSSTKEKISCTDKLCPFHGEKKLKLRGRLFEGKVIRKLHGRVAIRFERMIRIEKYERYEKRKTKIHARVPACMEADISVGDLIQIAETRPISKMIHFVVTKVVRKREEKE